MTNLIVVGEVDLRSDHGQVQFVVDPALTQSGVKNRGIEPNSVILFYKSVQ